MLPFHFNYHSDHVTMPQIRAGSCTLRLEFENPLPADDLYELHILSVRPSIIEITHDRTVSTSYFAN